MKGLVAERERERESLAWLHCVGEGKSVSCAESKRMSGLVCWPQWLVGDTGLHHKPYWAHGLLVHFLHPLCAMT